MNIFTGEKIQNVCDYYIGTQEDFNFNPYIRTQTKKHINIDNFDIEIIKKLNISFIFCYTHLINGILFEKYKKKLLEILYNINTTFSLVFHNSDGEFNESNLLFFTIPTLVNIYSQNIKIPIENEFINNRLFPIPIGIANSMWAHGNLNIWNNIKVNSKSNHIYLNFNIHTNYTARKKCLDIILSYNIPNLPNKDYSNYLQLLSSYKYAICPEGNGIDSHRFWECLYLKTIPICLKNTITIYYSRKFPVILLDEWTDLNVNELTEDLYNTFIWNVDELDFDMLKNMK